MRAGPVDSHVHGREWMRQRDPNTASRVFQEWPYKVTGPPILFKTGPSITVLGGGGVGKWWHHVLLILFPRGECVRAAVANQWWFARSERLATAVLECWVSAPPPCLSGRADSLGDQGVKQRERQEARWLGWEADQTIWVVGRGPGLSLGGTPAKAPTLTAEPISSSQRLSSTSPARLACGQPSPESARVYPTCQAGPPTCSTAHSPSPWRRSSPHLWCSAPAWRCWPPTLGACCAPWSPSLSLEASTETGMSPDSFPDLLYRHTHGWDKAPETVPNTSSKYSTVMKGAPATCWGKYKTKARTSLSFHLGITKKQGPDFDWKELRFYLFQGFFKKIVIYFILLIPHFLPPKSWGSKETCG